MIDVIQATNFVNQAFAAMPTLAQPQVLPYGTKLSEHLTVGIDHVTSPDTGEVAILDATLKVYELARTRLGRPIRATAGFRTVAHEIALQGAGYKTAKFVSPHCLGAALDCELVNGANAELQGALIQAAADLGLPKPRLGHKAYGERFTHFDMVFMIFQPYGQVNPLDQWLDLDAATRTALVSAWRPGVEW
jgi:hypothetical protein